MTAPARPVTVSGRCSASLLVVEDDEELLSATCRHLRDEGFAVEAAYDGEEALARLLSPGPHAVDAVVLDLLLPGLNGREVCYRLRAAGCWVPVIMATAFGELEDRLQGFRDGADDYLVKPFSLAELTVRLQAILRRGGGASQSILQVGNLRIDLLAHRATRGDDEIRLSPREIALLELFMRRPGLVLSRETIAASVWGRRDGVSANLLEQYVARLRRKLDAPDGRSEIETIPRVGYRLRPSE